MPRGRKRKPTGFVPQPWIHDTDSEPEHDNPANVPPVIPLQVPANVPPVIVHNDIIMHGKAIS